jgi:hypothetical protein
MAIQNHGPQVEAIGIAFLTLAWISVILRSTVRLFIIRLFRIDDWLAILVLVRCFYSLCLAWGGTDSQQGVFTLYCAIVLVGEKYGTGRLVADISQQDFQISMKVLSQSRVYIYIYIWARDSNGG